MVVGCKQQGIPDNIPTSPLCKLFHMKHFFWGRIVAGIIYEPLSQNDVKGLYINLNYLFSHNKYRIFIIIGARGRGKTYRGKKLLVKDKIYKNGDFCVLRDSKTACEEICKEKGVKFFADVFKNETLSKHSYSIEDFIIKIDDKYSGEVIPLNMYYKYKGNFYDVKNVFFDEFIPEENQIYTGDKARQFVNSIETITRLSPTARVILTANALDLGNEILDILGFTSSLANGKFGYYFNPDKDAILYYAPNSKEFEEAKANSLSGKIAKGTYLEANLINNQFENENNIYFEKREACDLFGIYHNEQDEAIRLYKRKGKDEYYCCKDINSKTYEYMRYTFDLKNVKNNRKYGSNILLNKLKNLYANHQVLFQTKYVFKIFMSILTKTKRK